MLEKVRWGAAITGTSSFTWAGDLNGAAVTRSDIETNWFHLRQTALLIGLLVKERLFGFVVKLQ